MNRPAESAERKKILKKVKNHSPLLAAVPLGQLLNLPVEVLCGATGGGKLQNPMALRKFGGAGPGGKGWSESRLAKNASGKYGKVRWCCGKLVLQVWGGGRGADRPKAPVEKMAKSDGIAEVW